MAEQGSGEIEFNSMVEVLRRVSRITYAINQMRAEGRLDEMLGYQIDFFKEISPDISEKELKETWNRIKLLRNKCNPITSENKRWLLFQLDDLDIDLRVLAKKAGFLTKTKSDVRKSVVDM
jgi:hypothetical protein